eukprot:PhM_4_TR4168/c1_g1_i2/m.25889
MLRRLDCSESNKAADQCAAMAPHSADGCGGGGGGGAGLAVGGVCPRRDLGATRGRLADASFTSFEFCRCDDTLLGVHGERFPVFVGLVDDTLCGHGEVVRSTQPQSTCPM